MMLYRGKRPIAEDFGTVKKIVRATNDKKLIENCKNLNVVTEI